MKDVSKSIYKIKHKSGFKKATPLKIFVITDNIFFLHTQLCKVSLTKITVCIGLIIYLMIT